jgi:tetratricopeptide (TPR) repeat protein
MSERRRSSRGDEQVQAPFSRKQLFLSWSGARSLYVARMLKELFEFVSGDFDVWFSEEIPGGKRWSSEIARNLERSSFGVICVTRSNRLAPWILFESGALARSVATNDVCPLLIDMMPAELTGPLSQFNCVELAQGGMRKLVTSVARSLVTEDLAKLALIEKRLDAGWEDFDDRLRSLPDEPINPGPEVSDSDMIGEILNLVRLQNNYLVQISDSNPAQQPDQVDAGNGLRALVQVTQLLASAKLKRDSNEYNLALQEYQKALSVDPGNYEAQVGICITQSYLLTDDASYTDVIRHLERIVESHARPSKALYNLACILNLERRRSQDGSLLDKILSTLGRAIEIYPRYRIIAAQDSDFSDLREDRNFGQLLAPPRGTQP